MFIDLDVCNVGNPRVICVAGAGRGPLVSRCLSAISRAKRNTFVYAIEKNPSAYVTYVEFYREHFPKQSPFTWPWLPHLGCSNARPSNGRTKWTSYLAT